MIELQPRSKEKLTTHPLKLIMRVGAGRHLKDDTKRLVTGIHVGLVKQLTRVNGIGVGADLAYDPIYDVLEERQGVTYNSLLAALSAQHYFFYGRLLFGQQLAYYVVPPDPRSRINYPNIIPSKYTWAGNGMVVSPSRHRVDFPTIFLYR